MSRNASECLYLYGIAGTSERLKFGRIGIEGAEPYMIPHKGFTAIVHDCAPEPYKSEDRRVVKRWIQAHENVLDVAMRKLGDTIPLRFDTIIKPENHGKSSSALKRWISKEFASLRRKMEMIRGKREYGVQVFYVPSAVVAKIAQENAEIAETRARIGSGSEGSDYMLKLKFESTVRKELQASVASCYRDFYARIRQEVDEVKVGRIVTRERGKTMMMNLSVLASKEQAYALGSSLDEIESEGFCVRFTGPWPPYSFV